jgi:hypothetical protein
MSVILGSLHRRNTRLNLFKEEVFISTYQTNITSFETHSIVFDNLIHSPPPETARGMSILEGQLLYIVRYYPFAFSFHDRVKVWNRMLDIDKALVDPNPMVHHEDIQIRRTYIYEDAFEKLSPENGRH